MIWKDYSRLRNSHAFCGASNYRWRNYDIEKLIQSKISSYATTIGTLLHERAAKYISKPRKMVKADKRSVYDFLTIDHDIPDSAIDIDRLFPNLLTYVNDAIGFGMDPEVTLYFSDNFYGTADAISWNDGVLRISDLKTGVTPASMMQLENYAAFFCLDYKIKPTQIKKIEFRIYQNDEIIFGEPDPRLLSPIIDQIIEFNTILSDFERR